MLGRCNKDVPEHMSFKTSECEKVSRQNATVSFVGGTMRQQILAVALTLASCTGIGPEDVDRIEVTPEYSLLAVGQSRQLSAVVYGHDGAVISSGGKLKWESTDSAAVSVDGSGRVRALRAGDAFIRATLGGVSGLPAIVEVPLTGTWTLRTANGLQVPATLNPNASCAPRGVAGSGAFTVNSGRIAFSGSRAELRLVERHTCAGGIFGTEGWVDIGYIVDGSKVTFLTNATDPNFARIIGTITATGIVVQKPTTAIGTYEAVFTK